MHPLLKTMRPKQWAKNVFVFAGLFFDGKLLNLKSVALSVAAFAVFCCVSSAIYLVNDLADIEQDRLHPKKRFRPLAAGTLKQSTARIAAVVLLVVALAGSLAISTTFAIVVALYAVIMLLYSLRLKHVVIIDVLIVAAGFVLRVWGGAVVVQVARFSPWLYVCTTLLALFIAVSKRRNELITLGEDAGDHRAVLNGYTLDYIDTLTSIIISTTLAAYSFYTFSAPNLPDNHAMMLTIPFVLYGLMRYMYLVYVKEMGGAPEEIALSDRPLIICIILWMLTAGIVIYPGLI